MKLFSVTITTEIVVVAEDAHAAGDEARDVIRELDYEEFQVHATLLRRLPGEWTMDSIPYGERDQPNPDRTIRGWVDADAEHVMSP